MQFLSNSKKKSGHPCIIHFVGIGGIGISGIAEIMNGMGYHVQGSDMLVNGNTERLASLGIKVFQGHRAENVQNVDYVVISTAVKSTNPEVIEAIKNHIPVISRSQMLAELMRFKTSIAVSGSHGKTTTTSLVASIFEYANLEPTVINGGIINNKATNAYLGNSQYLIVEADESDATFVKVPSTIAVITNIDKEHMDYYKNFDNLLDAFRSFISNLPFYGFAVCCIDHPVVRGLVSDITSRKVITYGIDSKDANITAFNIRSTISSSTYDVKITLPNSNGSIVIENITLPTPGRHNILNSLAAIAIAAELDFGVKVIKDGFKYFQGVKRRFTNVGNYKGVQIIDDYAHHPEEIKATIDTARTVLKDTDGKLIVVFQPHRYSRLENLFDDFAKSFEKADAIYIIDVYSAGEEAIDGINASSLVQKVSSYGKESFFLDDIEKLPQLLLPYIKSGDLVLMMGAGSITNHAAMLETKLRTNS